MYCTIHTIHRYDTIHTIYNYVSDDSWALTICPYDTKLFVYDTIRIIRYDTNNYAITVKFMPNMVQKNSMKKKKLLKYTNLRPKSHSNSSYNLILQAHKTKLIHMASHFKNSNKTFDSYPSQHIFLLHQKLWWVG